MSIGTNIRRLRRERDITQEQLADFLGISSRAVSQWETDRTAPDISQLPALASIFEVSADVILGIDPDTKTKRIEELCEKEHELSKSGEKAAALAVVEEGLREFPDSFALMQRYASLIWRERCIKNPAGAEWESREKRAVSYVEKILTGCRESKLRDKALLLAALWYPKLGRAAEAEELVNTHASAHTSGELLEHIYTGHRYIEQVQVNLSSRLIHAVGLDIGHLAAAQYEDGTLVYTVEEQIRLHEKTVALIQLMFEDGDYGYASQFIAIAYEKMMRLYANGQDAENALRCFAEMARHAVLFDTYTPGEKHTSLCVRGMKTSGIIQNDEHNMSFAYLTKYTDPEEHKYDFIRKEPAYLEVLEILRAAAK